MFYAITYRKARRRGQYSRRISGAAGDPRRPPREETSGKKTEGDTLEGDEALFLREGSSPPRPPSAPHLSLRSPEPQVGVHGAAAPERRRRGAVRQLHPPPGPRTAAAGSGPGRPSYEVGAWGPRRLPALGRGPGSEAPRSREGGGGVPRPGSTLRAGPGARRGLGKVRSAFPLPAVSPSATRGGRDEEQGCREPPPVLRTD